MTTLTTTRLRLRPMAMCDAPGYAALLSHPDIHPFVVEGGPVAAEDVPARIARNIAAFEARRHLYLSVLLGDVFIGYIALHGLESACVPISYALDRQSWGQGYMREALAAVTGWALGAGGFDAIEARVHFKNASSSKLLGALGFVEVTDVEIPARRLRYLKRRPTLLR